MLFRSVLGIAIVLTFLIMVAQFQSFKSPIIVMFTLPLAFTGGLAALLLTGMDLSIVAMVGFLVLSGVIVNNGIVFVDSVNQMRIGGMSKREALIETGRVRLDVYKRQVLLGGGWYLSGGFGGRFDCVLCLFAARGSADAV